jgi:hypothetical protein
MEKLERLRKERQEAVQDVEKVVDRYPTRDWNVQDFVGKCKIDSPIAIISII